MAFDAFFLSAVLEEVRERCVGARIDKIHQPSRDTLILQMHSRDYRSKLLFAANLHPTESYTQVWIPAKPGTYQVILSTDDHAFGGSGRIWHESYTAVDGGFLLYLPCRTAAILQKV